MNAEDRLLKYVKYYTTSDEDSDCTPSAAREFDLAHELADELERIGLCDVKTDSKCYVYGRLPATRGMENKKSMGFIAHMDTAPDFPGENVNPQIIENYDGKDVILNGTDQVLKVSDFKELENFKGRTLITTDGTTLLGADDKAGIAEIMTAIEIMVSENIPHGDIYIAFTPDEEIGRGSDGFDFNEFRADFAYTVDGDYEGEVAYENFNAASASFDVKGVNVHPGEAKDIMINASLVAAEIISMLPENETPAKTEDRQGFYHLTSMDGDVSHAKLNYIIRDHDELIFNKRLENLKTIAECINKKYIEGTVSLECNIQYRNMISVIRDHMEIVELAKTAIRENGLEVMSRPVRGGTDGAMFSFKGLPCPNLGTGGYGFHGSFEHITVEGMKNAVDIIMWIMAHPLDNK